MIPAEITVRREVVELVVRVFDRPPLRSAGHGDLFHPLEVTYRFASDRTDTPGALLMPVTVRGPAVAAQHHSSGDFARATTFRRAGELPAWVMQVAEWAKTQPKTFPPLRDRITARPSRTST